MELYSLQVIEITDDDAVPGRGAPNPPRVAQVGGLSPPGGRKSDPAHDHMFTCPDHARVEVPVYGALNICFVPSIEYSHSGKNPGVGKIYWFTNTNLQYVHPQTSGISSLHLIRI